MLKRVLWVLCGVLVAQVSFGPCHTEAQPTSRPERDGLAVEEECPTAALYCVDLVPIPSLDEVSGVVEMQRAATPFTVAVTPEGQHRYDLIFTVEGLPEPSSLGPYTTYVAWATTPEMHPVEKLGTVRNGTATVGEIRFNKFLILVTAEGSADVEQRGGKIVMRGRSPSSRLVTHDLLTRAPMAVLPDEAEPSQQAGHTHGAGSWTMPPMHPANPPVPGMKGLAPETRPFLPEPGDASTLPEARPREVVALSEGDTLNLEAGWVRRTIEGRTFVMYGFNEQYPGPLIQVPQKATIVVNFTNEIEWPTSVHWHGVRLDNRYDGVPGVTQEPVEPGETFEYKVYFRDAGIYWYHPHHREDVQQDLGLYGNMLVDAPQADYYNPVNRQEVLMLDDLLVGEQGLVPYGLESANYMLMGRFGNTFLINGEPMYERTVNRGTVVRFFLTNVSNTRTFNLSLGGAPMKVVGSDIGKYEQEEWIENVVIAPAERYIIEARFSEPGTVALTNSVQAISHRYGQFFPEVDTLGLIEVVDEPVDSDYAETFEQLRTNTDVVADIDRYRAAFDRPVDHELMLTLETRDFPPVVQQLMRMEEVYFNPVEWSGTMSMMNWVSTQREVQWILRDLETGRENMNIDWNFEVGDVVKVRLLNDRDAAHAMQHPIHIHGQRFLVLSQDGVPNDNLVWKDTVLVPVGSTAEILLEVTNPGAWMVHCHIAEHLESGMKTVIDVDE